MKMAYIFSILSISIRKVKDWFIKEDFGFWQKPRAHVIFLSPVVIAPSEFRRILFATIMLKINKNEVRTKRHYFRFL